MISMLIRINLVNKPMDQLKVIIKSTRFSFTVVNPKKTNI